MTPSSPAPLIAIACGGTGGHLFPGLAVGEELLQRGCDVLLLVSPKEVDQDAVKSAAGMSVATLPAVGLTAGKLPAFVRGTSASYVAARKVFQARPPQAVLAMGGFTSAPPILAGRKSGAVTFLHESNTIPGRANRWLAHVVDQVFVGFPTAAARLHHTNILATGTPVRPQFQSADAAACRMALGLDARRPVLLVMGGSQGASGLNDLAVQSLPQLRAEFPGLQFLHLTGPKDFESVRAAYAAVKARAVVRPFLTEMELALGAATLAVSRAGASSLAEFAALQVPAILVPFPAAADNHQFHNARAFAQTGAARVLEQGMASPAALVGLLRGWLADADALATARVALASWHRPDAAARIAQLMLALMGAFGQPLPRAANSGRAADDTSLRVPQSALA